MVLLPQFHTQQAHWMGNVYDIVTKCPHYSTTSFTLIQRVIPPLYEYYDKLVLSRTQQRNMGYLYGILLLLFTPFLGFEIGIRLICLFSIVRKKKRKKNRASFSLYKMSNTLCQTTFTDPYLFHPYISTTVCIWDS